MFSIIYHIKFKFSATVYRTLALVRVSSQGSLLCVAEPRIIGAEPSHLELERNPNQF